MLARDWDGFVQWHHLFDELCKRHGDDDNRDLAARYCQISGQASEEDFEAALRNFRNWRTGRHIPQKRKLAHLATLLGVSGDAKLRARWTHLYAKARAARREDMQPSADEVHVEAPFPPPESAGGQPLRGPTGAYTVAKVGGGFIVGVLVGAGVASAWYLPHSPDASGPVIGYREYVHLKVGQSSVIHGARSTSGCGSPAPSKEMVEAKLPVLKTGVLSDDGTAMRMSHACAGLVPVRAVRFTATTPGREDIRLFNDPITLLVDE